MTDDLPNPDLPAAKPAAPARRRKPRAETQGVPPVNLTRNVDRASSDQQSVSAAFTRYVEDNAKEAARVNAEIERQIRDADALQQRPPTVLDSAAVFDQIRRHRDNANLEIDQIDTDILAVQTRTNLDIEAIRARADQEIAARKARRADLVTIVEATQAALAVGEPATPPAPVFTPITAAPAAEAPAAQWTTYTTPSAPAPEPPFKSITIPAFLRRTK